MKKNKQIFAKRVLPVLLTLAMLLGAFPIMGISSSAATTYTKPKAGDLVGMDHTERVREEGDGSRYWLTLDDGVVHNIINRQFKESTIEDMNYDPDLRTYCIEWGARVRSSETLKGVSTSDSSFWNSLSQTAKEGILLTLGFGYPANTPAELGVSSADDAIAATQVLLWEFELGYRTDYEKHTTESILFDGRASTHEDFGEDACGIDGTAAESAYYAILAKAKAYKAKEGYSYTDLESSTKFLLWEGTDASQEDVHQVIACYLTPWKDLDVPGEPWEENGSIEVFKKDPNGNNLSGAMFSATNTETGEVIAIGPTDSNGYAITDGGSDIPSVPFGTYTVKETKAPDGYRLSSETWTVTLDENSPNGKATVEAVNTLQYVYGYATATKLLDGAAPGDARFTFTLKDSAGNTITTRENTSTGTFMFRDMNEFTYSMNDVGTHTYTITEEPKAGYSHDTHVLTVTHRVYMDNGTLKIEVTHSDGTTFSNTTYSASGSWKPTVTKQLNGATLQAGQFTFELVGGKSGTIYEAQTNKADGSVDFNGFNYTLDHVGTHTYIIRERKGNAGGYTYDEHEVVYTVTVSDAGDGTLKIEENHTGSTTFSNTYTASGSWKPTVTKQLTGTTLKAGQFTFELVGGKSGTIFETQTNMADGSVPFNGFNYTLDHIGTHTYIIRERKGSAGGYTYDEHEVVYTVIVSDAGDGSLKIEESHTGSTTFSNSYSASASWKPSVKKVLNGTTLKAGQFTFELVGGKSGTIYETQTNMADGSVPFNGFNYTLDHIGTHTYIIRERKGSAGGYTYDEHEVVYTVIVSDAGDGSLKIEESHTGSTTFTNSYSASSSWKPSVKKVLNGTTLKAGQFTFELVGGKSGTIYEAQTNKADGSVDFNGFNYTLADVGTHTYIIRERKGNAGGYTYDEHEVVYTVIVSDAGDGSLKIEESHTGSTTFTNSYSASSSWKPSVKKVLNGTTLKAGQFTFELVGGKSGTIYETQTNMADGSVPFNGFNYTLDHVGTHTYIIRERKGNAGGYTYDEHEVVYTVTVSDAGDGTLKIEESHTGSTTFSNTYSAGNSYTFEASKELVGGTLSAGQFTAVLTGNGKEYTAQNDANGKFTFETLNFTLADVGTKTYTLHELKGNDANIVYDSTVYTVTLEISDNGDGTLKIVPSIANSALKFTNYVPTGEVTIEATKLIERKELNAGDYTFELLDENGNIIRTAVNDEHGKITFDPIKYSLADIGTYVYTIREVNDGKPGITYDDHIITVTVTVIYDGNNLITVNNVYSESEPTFKNSYDAFGEFFATVTKQLNGTTLKAGQFTFELLDASGNLLASATNDADGLVSFDAVEYTLADIGTHTYTIREVNDSKPGYTYDGHIVTVTAIVSDNTDGTLKVDVSYEGNTVFENTYKAFNSAQIEVHKSLIGRELEAGQFTFELFDASGNLLAGATNDADGLVSFDALNFTEATLGEFTYFVREVNDGKPGYAYATNEIKVLITVVDNADGTLKVEVTYPDGDDLMNTYEASGSASISLIKRFENGCLVGGDFEFTLTDEDGNLLETATNDAEGNVLFSKLVFTQADLGTHSYTVREESGTLPGVNYSDKILRVIVTVVDLGNGELDVKIEYPDGNEFCNVYSAKGSFKASVWKQLIGKQLVAGMFNFELLDADGNLLDKSTNDADGLVSFDAIEYTLSDCGEHRYFIHEIKGDAGGITYDETIIEIIVTVSDNHDGTLKVDVSYPNGDTLTNEYKAVGNYTPHIQKVLTGTQLTEGQFTFALTDEDGNLLETVTNDAEGAVCFSAINYDLDDVGVITYKIHEVAENAPGYTYDDHVLTITVSIEDAGDGTLKVDVTYDGSANFVNHYGSSGSFVAEVRKVLVGRKLEAGQFRFELVDMITGEVISTATNDENGIVTFPFISYDETTLGAFAYIIREVNDGKPGYTYDSHEIKVLVTVVDNADGTLTVTPTYEGDLVFRNEYHAEGTADLSIYKELIGKELAGGEFSFELKNAAGEVIDTATNDADGKVSFNTVMFDQTMCGIHYYTISEVKGDLPGITYSDKILSVTVLVTDLGDGSLKATVTCPAGEVIQNVYGAGGEGNVEIIKQFTDGDLKGGEFDFELVDEEGKVIATAENDANGLVSFPVMEYTLESVGVYNFTVREVKGNLANVIYTDKILRVIVSVADLGNGELDVKIEYPDGTTLVNVYDAPEAPAKPEVPQTGDSTIMIGSIGIVTMLGGAVLIFARRKKDEE